jgi:hypothetical protein
MIPTIRNYFPNNPLVIIGDPAGVRRSDTNEGTCFRMLKKYFPKATVRPAPTNNVEVRIQATEKTLVDFPEGEPLVQFDPSMKWLIEGLRSRYRYQNVRNRDIDHKDRPEKNKWSHVVDANQYADTFLMSGRYDAANYVTLGVNPLDQLYARKRKPAIYTGY